MVGRGVRGDTEGGLGESGGVGLLAVAARGVGEAQRVEWDVGMLRRAGRGGRMAQPAGEDSGGRRSVVEPVGQRLVEHEVWDGFGFGGIEGRGLVEEEVSPEPVNASETHGVSN